MFEVDSHRLVPILGSYFFDRMPSVVPGIIDKHVDCIESLKNLFNRGFDCRDVAQLTVEVDRRSEAGCFNFVDKQVRRRILNIQKRDP